MKRIAVLASGSGTNAQRLIEHFRAHPTAQVVLVCCDQPQAGVLQRAWDLHVPSCLFSGKELRDGTLLRELQQQRIDLLVLAGFMRLIPPEMVRAFPDRIVNIHPALLPKYGGKGMYGMKVHEKVIKHHENESGCTVHFVDDVYDHGAIILQRKVPVLPEDTPVTLAERVQAAEREAYPEAINLYAEHRLLQQGPVVKVLPQAPISGRFAKTT